MEAQIFLNSVVFVFVMVRFGSKMFSRSGAWKLAVFIFFIILVNFGLMSGRFNFEVAFYKSVMIALGFLAGTAVIAYVQRAKE